MSDGSTTLTQPVRLRVIGRYLGQLALMLALLTLPPLGVSIAFGETEFAWRYGVLIGLLVVSWALSRGLPEPKQIQANEALAVVVLAFVIAALLSTFPLAASGLRFEDVLFEAVSAVTTTGLSTAGAARHQPAVFLFARAWMQWYGGLGIAVLSVALLMGHHAAARRLIESPETENIATTARLQARHIVAAYLILTTIGALVLWSFIGDPFTAVVYMLSTLSTGGFSPIEANLAGLPQGAAWTITAFSVLGAVPLLLFYIAARGRPADLFRDPEVRALGVMLLLVAACLALSMHYVSGFEWRAALQHGAMLGISAQTTTGFSSTGVPGLDTASKALMMVAMVIGGGSGSTAGGTKLLRLLVLLSLLRYFLRRTSMPPHATDTPRLAGRSLESEAVQRAALVVLLFLGAAGLFWLPFLVYGYAPLDALFEVVSALGTVGLSTGIAAPSLETPLKYLLCAGMLLGRLEFFALLVILYPRTWLGKRN